MSEINKDLFRATFARVSRHSFDTYRQHFLRRMPWLLLQAARQAAPAVANCAGFDQLYECLRAPESEAQTWKNAELFPYLNYVAFPQNSKRHVCVNALRVHCRLTELKYDTNPDVKYWRLAHGTSSQDVEVVWFDRKSAVRHSDLGWYRRIHDREIVVYRPHVGLFDDVEPDLYGRQSSSKSNSELDLVLGEAFSIIDLYSHSLCENILDQVSTVSLLKEVGGRPISYSLRNRYIGAIFITITSAVEMAEQIIHEYYHQCMWPWWLVEPPEDLPDTNLQVTSPITGAARSLPTMVQAILIYASLQDFYTFANEHGKTGLEDPATTDRARARAQVIRERFDDLAAKVVGELKDMPATRAVVDAILQLRNETLACHK